MHIWHGGVIVRNPRLGYSNGACVTEPRWDIDEINSIEVAKKVKLLGYKAFNVWYKHTSSGAAKTFRNDGDVVVFLKDVVGQNEVDFYVEHLEGSHPEVVIEGEVFKPIEVVPEGGKEVDVVAEGCNDIEVVAEVANEVHVVAEGSNEAHVIAEGSNEAEVVDEVGNEPEVVAEVANV